jgi:hypothetical protein
MIGGSDQVKPRRIWIWPPTLMDVFPSIDISQNTSISEQYSECTNATQIDVNFLIRRGTKTRSGQSPLALKLFDFATP